MEKEKNPFEVLLLEQRLVQAYESLPEQRLFSLIRLQRNNLLMAAHPDHGGSTENAKGINQAYEKLDLGNNPDSFRRYKEEFLRQRTTSTQLAEAKRKLASYQSMNGILSQRAVNLLIGQFFPGESDNSMYNVLKQNKLNVHDILLDRKTSESRRREEYPLLTYELSFDGERIIKNHKVLGGRWKSREYQNKILVGAIDEITANGYEGILNILLKSVFRREARSQYQFVRGMPHYTSGFIKDFDNRIKPQYFCNIIHLVKPEIAVPSYLFSMNREGSEVYFSLEGKVTQLLPKSYEAS